MTEEHSLEAQGFTLELRLFLCGSSAFRHTLFDNAENKKKKYHSNFFFVLKYDSTQTDFSNFSWRFLNPNIFFQFEL